MLNFRFIGLWFAMILSLGAYGFEHKVERLEPAFWWAGMQHNKLELLIYGENVSELTPKIKYAGVKISKVSRTDNPNYLFIELTLKSNVKPGRFNIQFDFGKETVVSYPYNLLAREQGSAERKGFSSSDAIYLITPDRFANGKPANDFVVGLYEQPDRANPSGRHGGDIAGMVQHIDYIAAMGFTQIWPNPLLENNQPKYSYHGYAITDLYQIDARFGSNEDYKNFVAIAKSKHVGVIQDVILNHIGSEHWWMKDLPSPDWLNSTGEYVETNHARTTIHDSYAATVDRQVFTDGWFVSTMPDLNQRNSHLANYLIQNTLWWIEYAGLSGIRTDTYSYPDKQFLTEWSRRVMAEYPNFNIVGEEWSDNPAVVAYWQRGKKNHDGYISYTPSMMDFPLREALLTGLSEGNVWHGGLFKSYEMLANDFQYSDPNNLVIFEGNHDTARIFSLLDENYDLFKLAMVYTATMRGIPQFFYGTEVLMKSPKQRDDGVVRSDFPGGWLNDKVNAFTGEGLTPQQSNAQAWLKNLLNWRKQATTIHTGKLLHFAPQEGVYVYFRYDEHQTIMIVLNAGDQLVDLPLNRFNEIMKDSVQAKNVLEGGLVPLIKTLELQPGGALILELL